MDAFMKATIDKLPAWSFQAFAVIICIGLLLYFYKTFITSKKLNDLITDIMKRDDRLEKINELTKETIQSKAESSQLTACISNVRQYIDVLTEIRNMDDHQEIIQQTTRLIQRMIEALAFDIKAISGEQHRCGIWSKDDGDHLMLICASFGFPKDYQGKRVLDINRSTAGRCYRKKSSINCPDVKKDEDWQENKQSRSPYKALICVPVGKWGVLSIDALEPMNDKCLLIGELYSSIFDGIMLEYYKALSFFTFQTEEREEAV